MRRLSLSIIIPTFNEASNIARCLERTSGALPHAEIIVVDGGSDATEDIVKEFSAKYPTVRYIPNKPDLGKGHAIRTGIAAAKGEIIVQLDADLQFMPEEIDMLTEPIRAGIADFVLGSRFEPTSKRVSGSTPFIRTLGNRTISLLASILFGCAMSDVLAGFKAWKRSVTESYALTSNIYSYEVELAIRALNKRWRVVSVPVTTEPREHGKSNVRIFRVGARIVYDIIRFRLELLR